MHHPFRLTSAGKGEMITLILDQPFWLQNGHDLGMTTRGSVDSILEAL